MVVALQRSRNPKKPMVVVFGNIKTVSEENILIFFFISRESVVFFWKRCPVRATVKHFEKSACCDNYHRVPKKVVVVTKRSLIVQQNPLLLSEGWQVIAEVDKAMLYIHIHKYIYIYLVYVLCPYLCWSGGLKPSIRRCCCCKNV